MSFLSDIDQELKDILSGEFTEPATLMVGSVVINFTGIFDKTSIGVDINSGAPMVSDNPQIGCHIDTINQTLGYNLKEEHNAIIDIRTVNYNVKRINYDGTGYATIILKK